MGDKVEEYEHNYDSRQIYNSARPAGYDDEDVFGHEEGHDIRYKTLTWPMVAILMIAEIVSNGKSTKMNQRVWYRLTLSKKACCHFHRLSQWWE